MRRILLPLFLAVMPLVWAGLFLGCPIEEETGKSPTTPTSESGGSLDSIESIGGEENGDDAPGITPTTTGADELPGPVALRFPRDITVDLDSLSEPTTLALGSDLLGIHMARGLCDNKGPACDLIQEGIDTVHFIQWDVIDQIFSDHGLMGCVEVESGTDVTQATGEGCRGGFFAFVKLFIDFSPFGSNDTTTSLCSGNTETLPVCWRVWTKMGDWERTVAGYFTSLPDETGEGSGRFWLTETQTFGLDNLSTKWVYDDPLMRGTEIFSGRDEAIPEEKLDSFTAHYLIVEKDRQETGCPTKLLKQRTVDETLDGKYIGQWKDCEKYWSGSVVKEWEDPSLSDTKAVDICADRTTGSYVIKSICQETGIDAGEENFLTPATTEWEFPSLTDFPTDPPE